MWEITARASTTPAWKGLRVAQEAATRKPSLHSAENQVLHPFQTCSPGPLLSLACLFTPVTPALGAVARQEDQSEFKVSLGYQGEPKSQRIQTEQNKKLPGKVIYTPMSQYLKERQVDQNSKASLGYLH